MYYMIKLLGLSFLLFGGTNLGAQSKTPLNRKLKVPIENRVHDLLSRMIIEKKAPQLMTHLDADGVHFGENIEMDTTARRIATHGLGLFQPIKRAIKDEVATKDTLQKYFVEKTRLGIPVLIAAETCYGLIAVEATSFPQAIGMASTWNPDLVRQAFDVAGRETHARGGHIAFAPVVDLLRDPRWGCSKELFCEDVYLTTKMDITAVSGLQGNKNGTIASTHIGTTLKHIAGHGQLEGGVNRGAVIIGENEFRNSHLKVFQGVIAQSNPVAIMPCYNAIDGVYAHMNRWLLQDVLRKELESKGVIVSDWSGIKLLHLINGLSENINTSTVLALKAVVELDQARGENYIHIPEMLKKDPTLLPLVDKVVARILEFKFRLGLFENPYITEEEIKQNCNLSESKQLAYETAAQSAVLLKNENNFLPLVENQYKSIAPIGAYANDMVLGGYSGLPLERKIFPSSLKSKLEGKATINLAKCFKIYTNHPKQSYGVLSDKKGIPPAETQSMQMREEALEVARKSELIIGRYQAKACV